LATFLAVFFAAVFGPLRAALEALLAALAPLLAALAGFAGLALFFALLAAGRAFAAGFDLVVLTADFAGFFGLDGVGAAAASRIRPISAVTSSMLIMPSTVASIRRSP
jgi:hypothetical protein